MSLVILTTGCRDWTDRQSIVDQLFDVSRGHMRDDVVVIHGCCPTGADSIVDEVAHNMGMAVESLAADWAKHGKAAGPIRNRQMVQAAIAIRNMSHGRAVCLAFWDGESRGTWNCIQEAVRAGLPVRIVPKVKLPEVAR
jgi:hypothetical protein